MENATNDQSGNKEALYNLDKLKKMGDDEFVSEMLEIFIEEFPAHVAEFKKLLANEDFEKIGKLAHKITPTTGYLGIASIKQDISNLEHFAENNIPKETLPSLVTKVVEVLSEAIDQINKNEF
ncbi:MAG: hypothetical protein B6D64_00045 [Bacteroidetes bacterium 4484_276]|nr:MAG: hypothetical protein B6D64_00045 [Bacteroidetes bacterium 4484_276]